MAKSRELLQRSLAPGAAPADWELRWKEPLEWPMAKAEAPAAAPPLSLEQSALVIVDIDKRALDMEVQKLRARSAKAGAAHARRIYKVALPHIIRLREFFIAKARPVIFVQWGWHRYQFPPLEPRPGEEVVGKRARGAFGTSSLDALLRQKKADTLYVVGTSTPMCVESTVRGAVDHGYRVVVVEDACICPDPELHACSMRVLGSGTARVVKTRQVLAIGSAAARLRKPGKRRTL